jgi:hypothetical protein
MSKWLKLNKLSINQLTNHLLNVLMGENICYLLHEFSLF